MYSADADGHFFLIFFFFLAYRSTGPNWSETQSPIAWVTPPPHALLSYEDLLESTGTYINKNINYS